MAKKTAAPAPEKKKANTRSVWTGHIQFRLVSLPIKIYTAARENKTSFNRLHATCKHQINMVNVCYHCGKGQPLVVADLVSGYQFEEGKFVVVTDEEKKAIQIDSSDTISITDYITDLDPARLDTAYFIAVNAEHGPMLTAYATLRDALKGLYGIGRWTYRHREYLVAVRAVNGVLMLHTLKSNAEMYALDEIPAISGLDTVKADPAAVVLAKQMFAMMTQPTFDFASFHDEYEAGLKTLIDAKIRGDEIDTAALTSAAPTTADLMAALKASLEHVKPPKAVKATVRTRRKAGAA